MLIDDPDDFRQLAERVGTLTRDFNHFAAKINRFVESFSSFSKRYPRFAHATKVIPVIILVYPDVVACQKGIPAMTKYEFVRFINYLNEQNLERLQIDSGVEFTDFSGVKFHCKVFACGNCLR